MPQKIPPPAPDHAVAADRHGSAQFGGEHDGTAVVHSKGVYSVTGQAGKLDKLTNTVLLNRAPLFPAAWRRDTPARLTL